MDRNQEYKDLLSELDNASVALEDIVPKSSARARKTQKIRRAVYMPASSIAAIFVVFVLLVNMSTSFAMAMDKIPVLRDLKKYVSLSPSLTSAVDNDYVQEIGLEETKNGVTMRIESVIVDKKQLNIFYSLKSDKHKRLQTTIRLLSPAGDDLSYSQSSGIEDDAPNGALRQIVIELIDDNMPESITIDFDVCEVGDAVVITKEEYDAKFLSEDQATLNILITEGIPIDGEMDEIENVEAAVLTDGRVIPITGDEQIYSPRSKVSTFTFTLDLNADYTKKSKTITLNKEIELDDQKLIVSTVEIYPTHSRVNFKDIETNTVWLQALTFYFINEKEDRFNPIRNGLTSTGTGDSPMLDSHRLESPFFYESSSLTMFITDIIWREKFDEKIKIDLIKGVAENLPDDVKLEKVIKNGTSYELIFHIKGREGRNIDNLNNIFEVSYIDDAGIEETLYPISGSRSSQELDSKVRNEKNEKQEWMYEAKFTFDNFPYNEVYLTPIYNNEVKLDTPVEVKIK